MANSSDEDYNSNEDVTDLEALWRDRPFLEEDSDDEPQVQVADGEKQIVLELEPLTTTEFAERSLSDLPDSIQYLMSELHKIRADINAAELQSATEESVLRRNQDRIDAIRQKILNLHNPRPPTPTEEIPALIDAEPTLKPYRRRHNSPIGTAPSPIARARPEPREFSLPPDQRLSYQITQRLREILGRTSNSGTANRSPSLQDFSLPEEHRLSNRIAQQLKDRRNRARLPRRNPTANSEPNIRAANGTKSANDKNSSNTGNAKPVPNNATTDINLINKWAASLNIDDSDEEEPEYQIYRDPRFILPQAIREREREEKLKMLLKKMDKAYKKQH